MQANDGKKIFESPSNTEKFPVNDRMLVLVLPFNQKICWTDIQSIAVAVGFAMSGYLGAWSAGLLAVVSG